MGITRLGDNFAQGCGGEFVVLGFHAIDGGSFTIAAGLDWRQARDMVTAIAEGTAPTRYPVKRVEVVKAYHLHRGRYTVYDGFSRN